MMKPTIHNRAMLRIPQFSTEAILQDHWDTLKTAIRHSSPNFYRYIENVDADQLDTLPAAIAMTVWKYFNRAKYRPVPYGHFAGITMVDVHRRGAEIKIADQVVHRFVNWEEQVKSNVADIKLDIRRHYLFANSSYYQLNGCIRYVGFIENQYQLCEIEMNLIVWELLVLCRRPMPYAEVIEVLEAQGCGNGEAHQLIASMLSLQLLIRSTQPNIIGPDFFRRSGIIPIAEADYVIAERPVSSGGLCDQRFRHIPELVSLLATKLAPQTNLKMTPFAARFISKYGDAEMPLMVALDPEYGIGYGELEFANTAGSLASSFAGRSSSDMQDDAFKDGLSALILNSSQKRSSIEITELLTVLKSHEAVLPNSISVLLSPSADRVYAESIGGSTAIAMMGRFTLASEQIRAHCRAIAALEAEANPEVVFFDIGYTAEKSVDNINRRESICQAQLNLLNYDTSDAPLSLTDLLISVLHGKVMLRSARTKKRLIPRLCSAYNYTRSDLSVFRFLCDLQGQGLQTDLTLDLQVMLPGLNYYPELRFKNIVLSPERWKVSALADLQTLNLPRYFLAGSGDQTLCFDRESRVDMEAFDQYLRKQRSTYIQEAFVDRSGTIKDEKNQPYHTQVLLSVTHNAQIYHAIEMPEPSNKTDGVRQVIPPGLEWLYFEIYCHHHTADYILKGPVAELLEAHSAVIEDWFFIRYTENGQHLRLRIHLKNPEAGQGVMAALTTLLGPDLDSGRVADLSLNTYKREKLRYAGNSIRDIERHFCFDSQYVLSVLPLELSEFDKYRVCGQLIHSLKLAEIFPANQFSNLIQEIALAYKDEHQIKNTDFKQINAAYKTYQQSSGPVLNERQHIAFTHFANSFLQTLTLCETNLREKLFSDLMHMHFNRLFTTSQRAHELIFFSFMIKSTKNFIKK